MLRLPAALALAAPALAALALAALAVSPAAAGMAVTVANTSRPTPCAEEDNVTVSFSGPFSATPVGAFAITAEPPPYTAGLVRDSTAPDFAHCDFSADPGYSFVPSTHVLHDGDRWRLVGHTFARFWRPTAPPVSVAGSDGGVEREEADLHLLQLFDKARTPPIEVVVLYPPDGYWRAKPLPPPQFADSAYGSSFLVGPVETDGRPLVRMAAVRFEPAQHRFRLTFAAGGEATVTVAAVTAEATRLIVALDPPAAAGRPFAALRSMFVTPEVADVAEVSWQPAADGPRQRRPILDFTGAVAVAVRFGRSLPSRHNTSAPDLVFDGFRPPAD